MLRRKGKRLLLVGEIIRGLDSRAPFQYYLEIPSRAAGRSQLKMEFLWRGSSVALHAFSTRGYFYFEEISGNFQSKGFKHG